MPEIEWVPVCRREDVPPEGGACVLYQGVQIAIFNLASRGEWYAIQNRCPHWNEQVLWRGLTGEREGEPKVACPMHKRTFSLRSGLALNEDTDSVATFPVRIGNDGRVFIAPPSAEILDRERAFQEKRQRCAGGNCGRAA